MEERGKVKGHTSCKGNTEKIVAMKTSGKRRVECYRIERKTREHI